MNTKIICFVAGKSGGHIIPCLTIAQNHIVDEQPKNILFFSANTPLDKTIISDSILVSWHIMLPLISRTRSLFITMWHIFYSFILSFFYLSKYRPESIITTGGIVAIPTCIAGFILRIPITVYSLDAVPGKAIQALTPLATSIITPFSNARRYFPAHKCIVAPYPLKYHDKENIIKKCTVQEQLGLSPEKKTVLLLGGSQGSIFLNGCMKQWIMSSSFPRETVQIIHQTGSVDTTDWKQFYTVHNVTAHVFSYHSNLVLMYAAADLIICRAGAGTLFEVKFFNKPCIIIPLKTDTTTHQVDNALAMVDEYPHLFCAIEQDNLQNNPAMLHSLINKKLILKK